MVEDTAYTETCKTSAPFPYPTGEKPLLKPETAIEIRDALGSNGAMWWSMCITGMNPKEYWDRCKVEPDGVRIYGTKRQGRFGRLVPLVAPPVKPQLTYEGFKSALQRLAMGVAPKSARDFYAQSHGRRDHTEGKKEGLPGARNQGCYRHLRAPRDRTVPGRGCSKAESVSRAGITISEDG